MTEPAIKWQIERAVFRDHRDDPNRRWILAFAPLTSTCRLVMAALLARADVETGTLSADVTPSLTELAALTGLDRSTVRRALEDLESLAWIIRHRPDPADARANGTRTWYRLGLPGLNGMPQPVTPEPRKKAKKPAQGGGAAPPASPIEVGAQDATGRGAEHPQVGAQNTTGRGAAPPITSSRPKRPSPPPPAQAPAPLALAPETGGGGEDPQEEQAPEEHDAVVDAVVGPVAEAARLDAEQLHAIRPAIAAALARGWPAPALAEHLAADLPDMRRPAALLGKRLKVDVLPQGPARCSCRGCTRWRRAADALARATPSPATCITHKVNIAPGERCPGCEADAAELAAQQRQDTREASARRAERHQRIEGARDALGLSVVGELTGQRKKPASRLAAQILGAWLDDHDWDLDAARGHAATISAREAS
ncbi:helix-turn-helix domain-containing protein [Frankia sp. AgB32]|uniref:helix-turn-helix domain-containing protein n=1 Tax=Frankia sp. AgB32 TaxID=631119 RepID=UPI00200DB27E|nr:helix-turn-helix domain-containing protein [Frankia sp. AgB32]MCK9894714.1 helix-turn-helix domain-containing protein [Frankia sp. AgB32]